MHHLPFRTSPIPLSLKLFKILMNVYMDTFHVCNGWLLWKRVLWYVFDTMAQLQAYLATVLSQLLSSNDLFIKLTLA